MLREGLRMFQVQPVALGAVLFVSFCGERCAFSCVGWSEASSAFSGHNTGSSTFTPPTVPKTPGTAMIRLSTCTDVLSPKCAQPFYT